MTDFRFTILGVVAVFVGTPTIGQADNFIFHDLTDVLSIEHQGTASTVVSSSCSTGPAFESCTLTFTAPSGDTLGFVTPFNPGTRILESDGSLSDFITYSINPTPPGLVTITFYSDIDGVPFSPPGLMTVCGGPCPSIVEDGSVQTAYEAVWLSHRDTVSFQSEVVPEPSSTVLLATIFAMVSQKLWSRRLRRSAHPE